MKTKILSFLLILGVAFSMVAVGATASSNTNNNKVDVLIGFNRTPDTAERAIVERAGGTVRHSYTIVPAVAASVPEAAIQGLLKNPKITSIELDGTVYAIDTELDNAWGVKRIGSGIIHDSGNKGAGVKVAIIDSGIDYNHQDLDANYVGGYDFVNTDTDPMDDNGHGTHVAGTVVAENDDFGVVGVAPEASLYALKVLNASGSGSWSNVIASLDWTVDNGIHVANLSLGSSADPGSIVAAAFDNTETAGVVIVAAAGNTGNRSGRGEKVGYPAIYDSVIAVGATDKNDKRASFSSTGSELELMAPGVIINSTKLGGGYVEFNGTSMASPHVAGAAALIIAVGITDVNNNGRINDEVRQVMNDTADDLGDSGRDTRYGYGLVNVAAAVATIVSPPATGTISGMVINTDTSNPIEGATVTDGTRQATTNAMGYYLIPNIPEGTYTVTASAPGYSSVFQTDIVVIADLTSIVNFSLSLASQATSVIVGSITYNTEGGRNKYKHLLITVALIDNFNDPVANALVSIDLFHDTVFIASGTDTTGLDGTLTFSLKNAPAGHYETEVTSVSAGGLTWNGEIPTNNEFDK